MYLKDFQVDEIEVLFMSLKGKCRDQWEEVTTDVIVCQLSMKENFLIIKRYVKEKLF